ncbi:MAG: hypothetical protein EOM30_08155 [Clostridia bacterium]|nr:hypothetical protein [Clostridia bacterium]NLS85064.1 hypothetical protein [Oscillospiraceae bacterium]
MITECAAIIAIILCMVFIFMRSGHGDYALSVLPLIIVPFVQIIAPFAAHLIVGMGFSKYPAMTAAVIDICALALTCVCIILTSVKIKSKKNKNLYIILMCGYSVVLTCALVSQTIAPLIAHN